MMAIRTHLQSCYILLFLEILGLYEGETDTIKKIWLCLQWWKDSRYRPINYHWHSLNLLEKYIFKQSIEKVIQIFIVQSKEKNNKKEDRQFDK